MQSIESLRNANGEIERGNIKKIIPYDDPFLMIDKVISLDKKNITAIKNVSMKDSFLKGHFVDFPIFPGALMIEGLGQAGTLLMRYNIPNHKEKDILAYKIKNTKFMYPIFPGDEVKFEVRLARMNEKGAVLKGKVIKDDKVCAESKMILAIVDKEKFRAKFSKKK